MIYHFADHGGREIGLRYDLTVPLARFVAVHRNELTFPFKRYHIGPVWRADRPQKGRYREFWQCDVDTIGSTSPLADAEVVAVVNAALDAIGFADYTVKLNHRQILGGIGRAAGLDDAAAAGIYRAND